MLTLRFVAVIKFYNEKNSTLPLTTAMLSSHLKQALPTTDELPCSDDTPVDNEDQNFLPNVLLFVIHRIYKKGTATIAKLRRRGSSRYLCR